MTAETELKLRIASADLAKLKRHPFLRQHQQGRAASRHVYSIYYDTPKLHLIQTGFALRLRKQGRRWLQTLKGGGSIENGLHQREEYEVLLSQPVPDLDKLQYIDNIEFISKKQKGRLQPIFVTDFTRNSRVINWQGAQIELCLDEGTLLTEHQQLPICEIELELKQGEAVRLFDLAQALLEIVPLELENISKAEQGYRLYAGKTRQPVRAERIKLPRHATLAQALQKLMTSCLRQFQDNLPGAKGADCVEFIHQMRIALRRLRVVMRMAAGISEDAALQNFRQQTADIARMLGEIREWDVFLAHTLAPMLERMPQNQPLRELQMYCMNRRETAYCDFLHTGNMYALQKFMMQFGCWLPGDYWQHFGFVSVSANSYAEAHIEQLKQSLSEALDEIDMHDLQQLHALRIKAKRLRYGTEFFASSTDKREMRRLLDMLTGLQDILGEIHDDAVALQMMDGLAQGEIAEELRETAVLVKGWIVHELAVLNGNLPELLHAAKNFRFRKGR